MKIIFKNILSNNICDLSFNDIATEEVIKVEKSFKKFFKNLRHFYILIFFCD